MLPAALKAGAERFLEGVSRQELARRAAALSSGYRSGAVSSTTIADADDVAAYLASRLPATFAACAAAFAAAESRAPTFAPRSLLDIGAGPGTASWAAVEAWASLDRVTMLDSNRHFLAVARELVSSSDHPALSRADIRQSDISRIAGPLPKSDLVVASYTLAELGVKQLSLVVSALWEACGGMLILVEPGTPAGYARLMAARAWLIERGAALVAPCPHAQRCPIEPPDWCHFSERLPRSRDHMQAKAVSVPFEDEKYAYVALGRDIGPIAAIDARILGPPQAGKGGSTFKLCTRDGIVERTIPRRDRAGFARWRRLRWGDAVTEIDG
jgi:ribosomal protein RSM22 (predicted rRNA methylase)